MKKDELVAYWLAEAEKSLIVAGHSFDNAVMANVAAFLERLRTAGMQISGDVKSCGYCLSTAMLTGRAGRNGK